ncbi:MAG TPA: hypothetical protein VN688_21375 [Gemmataceae bacterium]|nr:hypothetical protein [Gemmataceae bacterium]
MSQADFWYIRFPDGRILRAASTGILRQEMDAGHIPLSSTVRRSPHDEWVSLEWTQEFADLVEQLAARPAPVERNPEPRRKIAPSGDRLDSSRLHVAGVRGCLEELLAALDSTLLAKKIFLGLVAGLFLGGLLALQQVALLERDSRWFVPVCCLAAAAMIVLDLVTALLTQLTYIELARLRPARWSEGLAGLGRLTVRVVLGQVIVRGAVWGLIVLLRWLPYWLSPAPEEAWTSGQQIAAGSALSLGMVLEALLWPVFWFWWLLPPILVVEEGSLWRGLRQWLRLLRQHLGRVFLYQAIALGLGVLIAVPFLILIAPLFLPTFYPPEGLRNVAGGTRCLLLGLACAPMLTYWIVANVFIYLNLRYGASNRR